MACEAPCEAGCVMRAEYLLSDMVVRSLEEMSVGSVSGERGGGQDWGENLWRGFGRRRDAAGLLRSTDRCVWQWVR